MAKYILVKKVKGKKYEYQVIDVDSKAIVSKRTSAREYVACTADGSFYFGRLDLIGKGDHGKRLSHTTEILANPEKAYKKQIAYFTPDYRSKWIAEKNNRRCDYNKNVPIEQYIENRKDNKTNCLTTVTKDNVAVRTKQRFIKITEIEYRYLTPNEYELLQTVPIDYTAGISDSARRTMLGEGWTVILLHTYLDI